MPLFFSLLFASATNHAQIFLCKDATGRTITSDRPISECAERAVRELSPNGMLKREIAAPLTPEQKRQKQILEAQYKLEQAAAEEQTRRDKALLARYFNVSEIEAARKRAREPFQDKMNAAIIAITALETVLRKAEEEKEFYKKKALPQTLLRKIEEAESALITEKNTVQRCAIDIVNNDAIFDETLKRYRELTTKTVTTNPPLNEAGAAGKKY